MTIHPIFYDTETTGIKAEKDRIIEIAAFNPITNESFCSFVNPQMPIPEESTKITGITDEMVKEAPTFEEVGQKFFEFCGSPAVLIAHNNDGFDKFFLIEECKRSHLSLPSFQYIDTLKWARKYRPDLPRHALQYLREIYGIEGNTAHRALDDVIILYKVFSLMVEDLSISEILECLDETKEPIRQMPFGKHRGEPLAKLPKHYLKWLAGSGALEKPENQRLKESMKELGLLSPL